MLIPLDKTDHFKIGRKISYKSQSCKQDPKIMTREDEEEADEEEEDEEEEDDDLTLDDVKKGADTITSIAKAVKAVKDISDDSKSKKGYYETSTPRPHASDEKKPGIWGRYVLKRRTEKSDVEVKLDRIEKKIDKSTKHQNLKWYIGLGVAGVLAIIGLLII